MEVKNFVPTKRRGKDGNMDDKPKGVIVLDRGGRFLSRSMRWVRHPDRLTHTGAKRAYVHAPKVIRNGGPWADDARMVCEARYNPSTTYTEPFGSPMPFEGFLKALPPCQV